MRDVKELEKIAQELVELTNEETIAVMNILKEKHGLEVAQPQVVAAPIETIQKVEEKTSFDVVLNSSGGTEMQVIKAWKSIAAQRGETLSLLQARDVIKQDPPIHLVKNASKEDAENIKKELEALGAAISIQ